MIYARLADVVVAIHMAFVIFVVAGGLLVWRWPRLAWVHAPAAMWGIGIEWSGALCPLTPLENWLRVQGGERGYSGDFIARYLLPVLYPEGLSRSRQLLLGLFALVLNLALYGALLMKARGRGPVNRDRRSGIRDQEVPGAQTRPPSPGP